MPVKIKENISFQGFMLQTQVKSLEEEARILLEDAVKCEIKFAKHDLANGTAYEAIISDIRSRYSQRFHKPIIEILEKELRR